MKAIFIVPVVSVIVGGCGCGLLAVSAAGWRRKSVINAEEASLKLLSEMSRLFLTKCG